MPIQFGKLKRLARYAIGSAAFRFMVLVTALLSGLTINIIAFNYVIDSKEQDDRFTHKLTTLVELTKSTFLNEINEGHTNYDEIAKRLSHHPEINYMSVYDWKAMEYMSSDRFGLRGVVDKEPTEDHKEAKSDQSLLFTTKPDYVKIAFPIQFKDKADLTIVFLSPPSNWAELNKASIIRNTTAGIIVLSLGLPLAFYLSRRVTKPLRDLSEAAIEIAKGNLETNINIEGPIEIQRLSRSFRLMVKRLGSNINRINKLAYFDGVTSLPNRAYFRSELEKLLSDKSLTGTILFIDLDHFKKVNDTLGHDYGDILLKQFAERINQLLKITDEQHSKNYYQPSMNFRDAVTYHSLFSRLGGDEFTIILPNVTSSSEIVHFTQSLIKKVSEPFKIRNHEITIGASIGIALYPEDGSGPSDLLKSADLAMYHAKQLGRNCFSFFSEKLNSEAAERLSIEVDLRRAIENNELMMVYQPKIDLKTNIPIGVEALVRWVHPEKGMISPAAFIPVAEESGLIYDIGKFVLQTSCQQAVDWDRQGYCIDMSVNVSANQFEEDGFIDTVLRTIQDTGIETTRLELEVTETVAMSDPVKAAATIAPLRARGVRFAIDDFGTGYSSLSYLTKLPFDTFKIDRSFVMNLSEEPDARVICKTIIAMAQSLNYKTVAEGVETEEQARILAESGCSLGQGYFYAKPLPPEQFIQWYNGYINQAFQRTAETARKVMAS